MTDAFRRRLPADSNIAQIHSLPELHDHIRMLDAEGYPHAFLQIGALRLEFDHSRLADGHVLANVRIRLVEQGENQ